MMTILFYKINNHFLNKLTITMTELANPANNSRK